MAATVQAPEEGQTPKRKKAKVGDNLVASDAALKAQIPTIRKAHQDWKKAVEEARRLSGAYRNAIKIGVALGKHRDMHANDFAALMGLMDREPDDVDRETMRINWLARAAGVPLGQQLGMFDEQDEKGTVADLSERDKIALTGGAKSFEAGMQLIDCPYPEGHESREAWISEWEEAAAASVTKPNRRTRH